MAEVGWKIDAGRMAIEVVVPPGITATVTLPGSDAAPIEIAAGTHRWEYPYQPPAAARPPLSLDSTIGEIIDDLDAWTAVRATIARHMSDLAAQLSSGTGISGSSGLTLRQILSFRPTPEKLIEDLEAVLKR
jgi:alpha-L-rhamnosidase